MAGRRWSHCGDTFRGDDTSTSLRGGVIVSPPRVMLQVFELMVACGDGVGPGCVVWAGGGGCGSDVLARDYLEGFWLPCPLLGGSRHRYRRRVMSRLPGTPGGTLPVMLGRPVILGGRGGRVVIVRRGRVRRLGGRSLVSPTSLPVSGPTSTSQPPPVSATSPVSPPPAPRSQVRGASSTSRRPPVRSRRGAPRPTGAPRQVRAAGQVRGRLPVAGLLDRVIVAVVVVVVMVVVVGCGMPILVWC